MDGIVLLRFQSLCLKICALVTVLCMFVILPLNLTARCNYEESPGGPVACFNWEQPNLTNYDVTTLANIPDLSDNQSAVSSLSSSQHAGTLARLYIIVLCTWIIYFATCKALYWEWKTLLALRRVYYLEKDHWAERRSELEDSLLRSRLDDEEDKRMEKRDPWIPHPEQRETAVNVCLYSVLVGGLPSMPQEEMDEDDIEAAVDLANTKRVDWQLAFATKYFDSCVPNPLGYSSSVAAVTILPSASELANAWGKWYAAAGQLRRLRFIRSVIQNKVGYEINDDLDEDNEGEFEDDDVPNARVDVLEKNSADHSDGSGIKASLRRRKEIDREIFRDCTENQEYYRTVLGFDHGSGLGVYDFGPEQTAMYSREFAQGASSCCPYGCFEEG
ncbi:Calcium-dependent channel [Fragilaria crotonensis]|nr:Calcium-dependent channel [Fragilaria crotonensis]